MSPSLKPSAARSWLPVRLLLAVGASMGVAVLLVLVLYITDLGLSVWDRLHRAPTTFWVIYLLVLGLLSMGGAYLVWRVLRWGRPAGKSRPATPTKPPDEGTLVVEVEKHDKDGVPVDHIRRELEELQRRRAAGEIIVAVFGEISTGKSSMIRTLLPGTDIAVDVRGGTTREVTNYTWTSPAGDRLILVDLPGLNEADGALDREARDEALRAHVVIYVCEGDLTRDQYQALRTLVELGSPVILALNKIDRLIGGELELVRERLGERVGEGWKWRRCSAAAWKKSPVSITMAARKPPCANASRGSRICAEPCSAILIPTRKFWTVCAIRGVRAGPAEAG